MGFFPSLEKQSQNQMNDSFNNDHFLFYIGMFTVTVVVTPKYAVTGDQDELRQSCVHHRSALHSIHSVPMLCSILTNFNLKSALSTIFTANSMAPKPFLCRLPCTIWQCSIFTCVSNDAFVFK